MFAISVSSLFFYHLYLTGKNRTTLGRFLKIRIILNNTFWLESFRAPIFADGPQKDGFNLGYKQNFQEIFGKKLLSALIPIPTT
jgi:palmitoyltransferase